MGETSGEYPLLDEQGQELGKVTLDQRKFKTPPSIGFSYDRLPDGELVLKDFTLKDNDRLVPRVPTDFA